MGESIELSGGAAAYRAAPSTGEGSGVLVLHPWWGLNDTIRGVCDRLADAGFVALAPDLYGGVVVTTIEDAEAEIDRASAEDRMVVVRDAVVRLRGEPGVHSGSIGVVGFSMGAAYALELVPQEPSLAAVVLCYGTGGLGDWSASDAAFQGHFAADDPYESPEYVAALERALRDAGRWVEFHHYPGTRHWFLEPDRPEYDEGAANLAWGRMLGFLRERLD